jgi:hypothetical protein
VASSMRGAASRFPAGARTITIAPGERMIRVHHQDKGAIFFGPPAGKAANNRFDATAGEYRVLYAAMRLEGAFVETVLRRPIGRVLRRAFVDERVHSAIAPRRPLTLAKIFDEGLQVLGIDAGTISVDDYTASRSLALAVHQEFPDLDGVAYRSRYDNGEICFGVFDRVNASDLVADRAKRFDATPARVDGLMSRYGALFDTSAPA